MRPKMLTAFGSPARGAAVRRADSARHRRHEPSLGEFVGPRRRPAATTGRPFLRTGPLPRASDSVPMLTTFAPPPAGNLADVAVDRTTDRIWATDGLHFARFTPDGVITTIILPSAPRWRARHGLATIGHNKCGSRTAPRCGDPARHDLHAADHRRGEVRPRGARRRARDIEFVRARDAVGRDQRGRLANTWSAAPPAGRNNIVTPGRACSARTHRTRGRLRERIVLLTDGFKVAQ